MKNNLKEVIKILKTTFSLTAFQMVDLASSWLPIKRMQEKKLGQPTRNMVVTKIKKWMG